MKLIAPPEGTGTYFIHANSAERPVKTAVVSELGIFGWALFGSGMGKEKEKEAGWLVRTKARDTDEGGVAAGFSVLDSLLLVNE
jgi:glutathione synthase